MKYRFALSDFPESSFEMEHSIWSGKTKLYRNGEAVEQLAGKVKPFIIKTSNEEYVFAYPKLDFDLMPMLEINGVTQRVVPKLLWYEYVVGGLPFLLIFAGGFIGGALGAAAAIINYGFFRGENQKAIKYIKVIGVTVACLAVYCFIAALSYHLSH
jgi:hypothetical protein